ncbi:MAG TPA: glycosyltransferase family 39 protein, partial [Anaerolineales bacterium]|nr:glycosyltransferase family 39 protein [Anaerolineales bacterium]
MARARDGGRNLIVLAREELPRSELGQLRLSIMAAALLLNASIGYAYASQVMVEGWQLWTWLISIVVAVICLWPGGKVPIAWSREAWLVLALTLAAAAIRLTSLESIPPGLHGDESRLAQVTLRHVYAPSGQTLNPFRSGDYSQPTLYQYILWGSMRLFGETKAGLRLPSALAGSLSIPFVYLAVGLLSGRRAALFASTLLVGYHYHVHWSRLALNNAWDTLWIPAMIGLFAWGWERRWSGGALLAGLAMGGSQYFYAGSRIGVFLLAYVSLFLWRRDRDSRRWLTHTAMTVASAAVVSAPLTLAAIRQPESFISRFLDVLFWRPSPGPGVGPLHLSWLEAIGDQLFRSVAGFTSLTETTGFYGPDVPLVMGIAAPLFVAGILWAIVRREFVPVLWIGLTMFFGGFLLSATPGSSHYVTAIPAV